MPSPKGCDRRAAVRARTGGTAIAQPPPAAAGPNIPVSSTPPYSRGCAIAVLGAAGVAVVLLLAVGAWGILALHGADDRYGAPPECAVGETAALEELVPGYRTELDESIRSLRGDRRQGRECRWATPEDGRSTPAAATLVMVTASGRSGERETEQSLRATAEAHDPQAVSGLGEEAYAWHTGTRFGWGCTGLRVSNLYLEACYTAATDYEADRALPRDEAMAGAQELARAVLAQVGDPD